jgi:hypothetical protein
MTIIIVKSGLLSTVFMLDPAFFLSHTLSTKKQIKYKEDRG